MLRCKTHAQQATLCRSLESLASSHKVFQRDLAAYCRIMLRNSLTHTKMDLRSHLESFKQLQRPHIRLFYASKKDPVGLLRPTGAKQDVTSQARMSGIIHIDPGQEHPRSSERMCGSRLVKKVKNNRNLYLWNYHVNDIQISSPWLYRFDGQACTETISSPHAYVS